MKKLGLQKAYEKRLSFEMCFDLAGKFARKSANRTDDIGEIRLRYETIVQRLRCLEPLASNNPPDKTVITDFARAGGTRDALVAALRRLEPPAFAPSLSERWRDRYKTNRATKSFLVDLESYVRRHLDCLNDKGIVEPARLDGDLLGAEFTQLLTKEWLRDRKALMDFLFAIFCRWREIDKPDSLWRSRIVTYQVAPLFKNNDRKGILEHLQKIGIIPPRLTPAQLRAWLNVIGQHISRDAKEAAGKNFGFGPQ